MFKSEHRHKIRREWDEKVNCFRVGLENMLGDRPGSTRINSEPSGTETGPEEGVSTTNPVQ